MENNPKNQIVQRLKEAKNILVTVNANPSIDQLAAALGITLLMNKIDKRATAVFSGKIPSTLEFLQPEDTIESNTDSLRDFIIALDKSKADKLKYKVEDDVVKVFITPYKASLSQSDLSFSQGDFNVDVVLALGVRDRDDLDKAITAHGRILHDATVIGVTNDFEPVEVGSLNWQDNNASSLCEMMASVANSFKKDAMDSQIATAFLTGIVAETDRFSNEKTSPQVMSLSASLMSAGANQQLISNELALAQKGENVNENEYDELPAVADEQSEPVIEDIVSEDGTLTLSHVGDEAIHIDEVGNFKSAEELNAAVNEVQENSQNNELQEKISELDNNQVIETVKVDSAPGNYSRFVGAKPTQNPINSNILSPDEEPMVDPLSEIPVTSSVDNIVPDFPKSTESPLLATQHDAESPSAASVPSTEDQSQRLPSDGETAKPQPESQPSGVQIDSQETLEDIEKRVLSFEEASPSTVPTPTDSDAEAARQAVLSAMDEAGNFNPERPAPLESMGAVEFPSPVTEQPPSNPEEVNSEAIPPPDAPPPFIPPFPTYDPNEPSQNQNQ